MPTDCPTITIRVAREEDLPQIVAIYNSTIPGRMATADTVPVSVESRRGWFENHNARRPLWVAVEKGVRPPKVVRGLTPFSEEEVLGYLSLRNHYGRPAYHITAELGVYVHEGYRRKGVASMLLEHAIAAAPKLGLENLLAVAFAHNGASIRFFTRYGFVERGRLPGVADLDGKRVDVVYMVRSMRT